MNRNNDFIKQIKDGENLEAELVKEWICYLKPGIHLNELTELDFFFNPI